jgi:lysophospholipase L1-like esterase
MRLSLLSACTLTLLAPIAHAACPMPPGPPPIETHAAQLPDPNWQARVDALDALMASTDLTKVRTVFLGDSLTEAWPPQVWGHFYGHRDALNLGVRGDFTQGLLWRIARLKLGTTLKPQLFVLLIGTNNLWPNVELSHVVAGIGTVIAELRRRSPASRILLLDLLPRGVTPDDPSRQQVTQLNRLLAACAEPGVDIADPGPILLDGHGMLTKDISFDALHLTWVGYAMLGAALEPVMKRELGD